MESLLLRACRREPVERPPVWFMRQAGRYLPEYRAIREKHKFLEVCRRPELCVEVTLQPVRRLGVDAAILFSDILVPVAAMGASVDIGDDGPKVEPIRDAADVERLRVPDPAETTPFVLESIRALRGELAALGGRPLIGFCGGPFTLASYLLEGGSARGGARTKQVLFREPALFGALVERLTQALALYARAQVEAGAQVFQVFDSWVGSLSPEDFERVALEPARRVVEAARAAGAPTIYFGVETAGILERMTKTGADVVGVDWRIDLDAACARLGPSVGIQGNLDPAALFLPQKEIRVRVGDVIRRGAGAPGHVFNLGHGILPETPVESAQAAVDAVVEIGARSARA